MSEGWRDAARIANKEWCKKAADELLHTLATALEEILEEYKDGEETLAELLDFYIEDLEERLTDEAERDKQDALVKILEDWENGKLPMTFGAGGPPWALNSGRSSYFAPSLLGARGVVHASPLAGAGGVGQAPPLVDAVGVGQGPPLVGAGRVGQGPPLLGAGGVGQAAPRLVAGGTCVGNGAVGGLSSALNSGRSSCFAPSDAGGSCPD